MSKNVVNPKRVSFEDALRNLASRLTGRPVAELPRSQEGAVQFMAENVPTFDEMAEAITQEVLARLEIAAAPAKEETDQPPPTEGELVKPNAGQQETHNGPDTSGGTSTPEEGEKPNTEAPVAADKPKRGSKAKTAK
ncbi:MAG: hypothetical protein K2K53_09665 [Oscillospiraceae bacterium]|nr:hypothetical protein [Oscillospiraceae bacterium]